MDHQQYKLIAMINFVAYPVENGKMLPSYKFSEKYVGTIEGSIDQCKEFVSEFVSKHNEIVKTRG